MFFWKRKPSLEVKLLEHDLADLREQLARAQSKCASLETQNNESVAQVAVLSTKLDQLDREFQELTHEITTAIDGLGIIDGGIKSNRKLQSELDEVLSVLDRIRGIVEQANKDDN